MESDTFWALDREGDEGVELTFCCLNPVLRDYAKLGRLFLRHGDWEGTRIVSEEWVLEATTSSAPHLQPGVARPHWGYAYQWWLPLEPDREFFAAGIYGQYVYVSEPDDLIIVRTSSDPNFIANMEETVVVFRAIRDHLQFEPAKSTKMGEDQARSSIVERQSSEAGVR